MKDYLIALLYALAGWAMIESIWKAGLNLWHTRKLKEIETDEYCDKCYHSLQHHRNKMCKFPYCVCGLTNEEIYGLRLMMHKKESVYDATNTETRASEEVRDTSGKAESVRIAQLYQRGGKKTKMEKRKSVKRH